jgi:glycosyltransferase A (GT-A) superfamily protein (DUF2064 family)
VLGPAEDGGYYLLGVSTKTPDIFTGIRWSSPDVWPQTIARADELGLNWASLPAWYDVDTPADLDRLKTDLATTDDPALIHLRDEIESAPSAVSNLKSEI